MGFILFLQLSVFEYGIVRGFLKILPESALIWFTHTHTQFLPLLFCVQLTAFYAFGIFNICYRGVEFIFQTDRTLSGQAFLSFRLYFVLCEQYRNNGLLRGYFKTIDRLSLPESYCFSTTHTGSNVIIFYLAWNYDRKWVKCCFISINSPSNYQQMRVWVCECVHVCVWKVVNWSRE